MKSNAALERGELMNERILVVYFSRSGRTRSLALAVAESLHCDIEEIAERRSRTGVFGSMRSGWEAVRERPAVIDAPTHHPASYDLVVIGTPVWAGAMSSPVRAYLTVTEAQLRDVVFFCTLGGFGARRAFEQMLGVAGKAPRAVCYARQIDMESGAHRERVASFAKALAPATTEHEAARPSTPPPATG